MSKMGHIIAELSKTRLYYWESFYRWDTLPVGNGLLIKISSKWYVLQAKWSSFGDAWRDMMVSNLDFVLLASLRPVPVNGC